MPRFNRVTIVGLGLIGGSLGMAIKRHRLAREVVGVSRRITTLREAKRRGAIDRGTTDARRAVRDADLVILATPVDVILSQAGRLAQHMPPGSILSDVGSSKATIVRTLERTLPKHVAFVGAHPIAGTEQRGIEAADAHLFDRSLCIVTRTSKTNRQALRRVASLWRQVSGAVMFLAPAEHDRLLGETSHLTHLIACTLVHSTSRHALARPPRSWLEMTRIAKSDPDLWDDIFLSNRAAVAKAMDRFDRQWHVLRRLLARHDRAGLRRALRRAKSLRDAC